MARSADFILDRRIVRRNIRKGLISREDYLKSLEDLPDRADNAETVDLSEEESPETTIETVTEDATPVLLDAATTGGWDRS